MSGQLNITVKVVEVVEVNAVEWSDERTKSAEATAPTISEALAAIGATDRDGDLDAFYSEMAALGVRELSLTAYPDEDVWQTIWRHPANSGMSTHTRAKSAAGTLRKAVEMESKRQRDGREAAVRYAEAQLERARREL